MSHGKSLFQQSFVYGLGQMAMKAVGFLLLPIYTRYLTPADYGVLELLGMVGAVLGLISGLGLPSAFFFGYFKLTATEEEKRRLTGTTCLLLGSSALLGAGLLAGAAPWLGAAIHLPPEQRWLLWLIAGGNVAASLGMLPLSLYRAQEKPVQYVALSVGQGILGLLLTILLVVGWRRGAAGVLGGQIVATAAAATMGLSLIRKHLHWHFSWDHARRLLAFGLPLVPQGLAGTILEGSDRYLLARAVSLHDIGLYGMGYKFAMLVQLLLVGPFTVAWPVFFWKVFREEGPEGAKRIYADCPVYVGGILLAASLGLILFSPHVIRLMTAPPFHEAWRFVGPLCLSYVCNGVFWTFFVGLNVTERTRWLPLIFGAGAAANVGLNLWWIPHYGTLGSAWATVAAYAVIMAVSYAIAQQVYPVPYPLYRLAALFGSFALLWGLHTIWQPGATWADLIWSTVLMIALPMLWWFTKAIRAEDVARIQRLVVSVLGKEAT